MAIRKALLITALFGGLLTGACGSDDSPPAGGTSAVCGDGVVDTGEECDGAALAGASCDSTNMGSGTLACKSDCTLDYSGCSGGAQCGNGVLDSGEQCDGSALGSNSCESAGFGAGTLACNANCTLDTRACCSDLCSNAGATQCNGDTVQNCNQAANGCLDWADGTDCAGLGQVCADGASGAQCSAACTDQCSTENDTQCNGDVIETCTKGADGCLDWTAGTDCATNSQACDATSGTASCVSTCTDQCQSGALQCAGNVIQTCKLSGGCLKWSSTTDCTATGQQCDGSGATPVCYSPCTNQCTTVNDQQCNGMVVQTCTLGSNGCRDWGQPEDCAATNKICVQTVNTAACFLDCSDTCSTENDTQCSGTVIETCTLGANGCKDWVGGQDCALTGQTCGGTAGAVSCQGTALTAEDCAGAIEVTAGTTTINWAASQNDYLTTAPSCLSAVSSSYTVDGPDIVLSYTAPANGKLTYSVDNKPASTRWVVVASNAACGTPTETSCATDFTDSSFGGKFDVVANQTYYFYIADTSSGTNPLSNPLTFTVNQITPPCTLGSGGLVNGTLSRVATSGFSSLSEYYLAADNNPNGYVYVGGTIDLFRIPKAGGAAEDVYTSASLSSSNLGYTMLVNGNDIFTLESKSTGTTGFLWRLSSNGGTTWNVQDYATFAATPGDDMRGITAYKGKIYMTTEESTSSTGTQIWSMDAAPTTIPGAATLLTTLPATELGCHGIAVDDNYFYLTCYTSDHVVRVDRTSGVATVMTTDFYLNTSSNSMHAVDTNSDGTADFLYFNSYYEEAYYICAPASAQPYADTLANWGTGSSNYGMGYDSAQNVVWAWDDDTRELIKIQ